MWAPNYTAAEGKTWGRDVVQSRPTGAKATVLPKVKTGGRLKKAANRVSSNALAEHSAKKEVVTKGRGKKGKKGGGKKDQPKKGRKVDKKIGPLEGGKVARVEIGRQMMNTGAKITRKPTAKKGRTKMGEAQKDQAMVNGCAKCTPPSNGVGDAHWKVYDCEPFAVFATFPHVLTEGEKLALKIGTKKRAKAVKAKAGRRLLRAKRAAKAVHWGLKIHHMTSTPMANKPGPAVLLSHKGRKRFRQGSLVKAKFEKASKKEFDHFANVIQVASATSDGFAS